MLTLLSRTFGLFSFKSRKTLFIIVGLVLLVQATLPSYVAPALKRVFLGARINQIVKLNALERAKIKEPLLKESYGALLTEYAKRPPAVLVVKREAPLKVGEYFKRENVGYFMAGFSLWALLAVAALLSSGSSALAKAGACGVFLVLALVSGAIAAGLPLIKPYAVFLLLVVAVETAILSVVGTLSSELNRRA